jgi:L-serine/L-threonine ammonia-lyase
LATETFGAASLAASLQASYLSNPPTVQLQTLPAITSIATSLGAKTVSRTVVESCLTHRSAGLLDVVMDDARTVAAVKQFAGAGTPFLCSYGTHTHHLSSRADNKLWCGLDDHQVLVDPACGSALSLGYDHLLLQHLLTELAVPAGSDGGGRRHLANVVIVVCGGGGVTISAIREWEAQFSQKLAEGDLGPVDVVKEGERKTVTF